MLQSQTFGEFMDGLPFDVREQLDKTISDCIVDVGLLLESRGIAPANAVPVIHAVLTAAYYYYLKAHGGNVNADN